MNTETNKVEIEVNEVMNLIEVLDEKSNQRMIILKVNEIIERLVEEYPLIKSVIQNLNPQIGNVILVEKSIIRYGTKTIITCFVFPTDTATS